MTEYIFTIIGASVICTVIILFLPDGELSKYVRLLAALALLCTIALPAADFFHTDSLSGFFSSLTEGVQDDGKAEEKYYGVLTEISERELENQLISLVCEKFDISENDINITVEASEKDGVLCIDRVTVGLFGAAVLKNPYEIEEFSESLVGADCDVYY